MQGSWLGFALLSAASAALVAIFGKLGLTGIHPTLATSLRSVVMMMTTLAVAVGTKQFHSLPNISGRDWLYIFLSGVAGSVSWLAYFTALKLGDATKVAPVDRMSTAIAFVLALIVLGERPTPWVALGNALVLAGGLIIALSR